MDIRKQALKEKAIRELERRYKPEREDLLKFIQTYFKEENPSGIKEFLVEGYHKIIADKLHKVYEGKIDKLIINIPPRHGKTELITQCFPVWLLGNDPTYKIISTGFSADNTQAFSKNAKDYYKSKTFTNIFPRHSKIKKDQDTKTLWELEKGGSYYATGTGGSITGKGANLFIIDDPIKPDEADKSEIVRVGVNNWFSNTVRSRLASKALNGKKGALIIIMQRTHDNDLCGYILDQIQNGSKEKWDIVSLPAIAEEDEYNETKYGMIVREQGEVLHPILYPLEDFEDKRQTAHDKVVFECQYQQNPTSRETQEFHSEWFKYYHEIPTGGRVFTTVDPAFSKRDTADSSAITTVKFVGDDLYILEQTVGKFDPAELEDQMIRHVAKRRPEKIGIEAFQAQSVICFSLKSRLKKEKLHFTEIQEIRQSGDKEAKIRSLIPLYRNGHIYHNNQLDTLEDQLIKFPRGRHDDAPDSLQMALYLYELMPNTQTMYKLPTISYGKNGMPIIK